MSDQKREPILSIRATVHAASWLVEVYPGHNGEAKTYFTRTDQPTGPDIRFSVPGVIAGNEEITAVVKAYLTAYYDGRRAGVADQIDAVLSALGLPPGAGDTLRQLLTRVEALEAARAAERVVERLSSLEADWAENGAQREVLLDTTARLDDLTREAETAIGRIDRRLDELYEELQLAQLTAQGRWPTPFPKPPAARRERNPNEKNPRRNPMASKLFTLANEIMVARHGEPIRSRQIEALADAVEQTLYELHETEPILGAVKTSDLAEYLHKLDEVAVPGARVVFSYPDNGYEFDRKHALSFLIPHATYTVKDAHVGDWRTELELVEVPGYHFNSVHFSPAVLNLDEEANDESQAG